MNRRGFLAALVGVPFLAPLARLLPKAQPLAFHPQAFAMAMESLPYDEYRARYIEPAIVQMQRDYNARQSAILESITPWTAGNS